MPEPDVPATPDPTAARAEALQRLEDFTTRILPAIVRRILAWKGLPVAAHRDLLDDLRQELAVDCLEHPELAVALPATARHARWIRLAERWIYHNRVVVRRQRPTAATAAATVRDEGGEPPPDLPAVVPLRNGRCNLSASARQAGICVPKFRQLLDQVASNAGAGQALSFWRQRIGETLVGLAADLLQEADQLVLAPRRRRPPDPPARLRRLRQLANRLPQWTAAQPIRQAIRPWLRRATLGPDAPRQLLQQATWLCPDQSAGWLWLFEACLAAGDLPAATAALRRARATDGEPGALLLARARLLEARQRFDAATRLLGRAMRRRAFGPVCTAVLARFAHRPQES